MSNKLIKKLTTQSMDSKSEDQLSEEELNSEISENEISENEELGSGMESFDEADSEDDDGVMGDEFDLSALEKSAGGK